MIEISSKDHKRLYEIHRGIIRRCHDPTRHDYPKYGGHGIRVCDDWRFGPIRKDGTRAPSANGLWNTEGLECFIEWAMTHGYRDGMTIDRVCNNRSYSPGNTRWISKKAQAYNRRTNVVYTLDGETHTLTEWSKITGLPDYVICKRMKKGWGVEKTLKTPLKSQEKSN